MKAKRYFLLNKSVLIAVVSILSYGHAYAESVQYADGHPAMPAGVVIEPLENHQVPGALKIHARQEIEQMKARGFVDASEDSVGYLDRAKEDKEKRLKPWDDARVHLKISPATVQGVTFEASGVKVLGAVPSGIKTTEGWTAVSRLIVEPKLGLMMLEEIDYVASGGGLTMIKEAINEDINGRPAILRVKTSQRGKSITELTWATDQKIYTLSANRTVKGSALDEMLSFAKNIQD